MAEANYKVNVAPADNKSWEKAEDLDVTVILELEGETRSFKGRATMFGISKKYRGDTYGKMS